MFRDPYCSADCARADHGDPWERERTTSPQEHRKRHGIERYRRGCRCDVCRAAARDHKRAYRERKRAERAA